MKALHQILWMLISIYILTGCETAPNRIIAVYDDTRAWKTTYSMPPANLLARVREALEAEPLSLATSTSIQNKLNAFWIFPGKYDGIWLFGSKWDSRFSISVAISPTQENNQSELILTTTLEERPNLYWEWRRARNFGVAESQFDKIVHVIQSSIAKK